MILYIAGPMSGLPQDNYPAFEAALESLRKAGYDAVSPHTVARPEEILKSRSMGVLFRATPEYASIMRRCISLLHQATAVALLPGWEESRGAQREVAVAEAMKKPVQRLDVWLEMAPDIRLASETAPRPMINWVGDERYEPRPGYGGDAGLDLYVAETTVISPSEFKDIPLGIDQIELPPGVWALLTGRSSTIRRGLLVTNGIIDNGYRGALFAGTQNVSDVAQKVSEGERIAQLIPFNLVAPQLGLRRVEDGMLSLSDRGQDSFGSTGR